MTFEPRLVVSASEAHAEARGAATVDADKIARGVRLILEGIGENPERAGLADTPGRVAESYGELFSGYAVDPVSLLQPLASETARGLVMVHSIPLVSICEHHLLPFTGTAAVAYLPGPDGRITGLSKIARLMEVLSRRLQVQERLVREAADALEAALTPAGVFVLVEAEHLCMTIRGARAPGSVTVTTEARGVFEHDTGARAELAALARAGR
ncbi:MAG: GTP cyclohydrolase I FolE [Actinomycetota bacterium]